MTVTDIIIGERKEADEIVLEADHQDETREGHTPGDNQDEDKLEEPCLITLPNKYKSMKL